MNEIFGDIDNIPMVYIWSNGNDDMFLKKKQIDLGIPVRCIKCVNCAKPYSPINGKYKEKHSLSHSVNVGENDRIIKRLFFKH